MKGFAHVDKDFAMTSVNRYESVCQNAKTIRDNAISSYYEKYYINGSRLTRLVHRNKSEVEFVYNRIGTFGSMLNTLSDVLSDEDFEILRKWWYSEDKQACDRIKQLCDVTSTSNILVDHGLAKFINSYGESKCMQF